MAGLSCRLRLSVLDQSPIRKDGSAADAIAETIALAKATEGLGYHRYWLAEHHNSNSFAGAAPEVLIARVAAETSRIRVGSGGVMLMHYSPLKVAEQFRMLETLSPGRIDLGIGRAPGSDERTARALQAGPAELGHRRLPEPGAPAQAVPGGRLGRGAAAGRPSLSRHPCHARGARRGPSSGCWARACTARSMPAEFGLPFAHAHFISPDGSEEACDAYRERFKPSPWCAHADDGDGGGGAGGGNARRKPGGYRPRAICGWCGCSPAGRSPSPRPEEALDYPYNAAGAGDPEERQGRSTVGTAPQVRAELETLAARHGAEELVVVTITYDYASRLRSYELLAKEFAHQLIGNRPITAPVMPEAIVPETSARSAKRHDLVPALGHQRADRGDHDADRAEIGEAAQRIEHDEARTRIERAGRQMRPD